MKKRRNKITGLHARLSADHDSIKKIIDGQHAELDALPCGGTVGEKGVEILGRLDVLEKAADHLSAALVYMQRATEL